VIRGENPAKAVRKGVYMTLERIKQRLAEGEGLTVE
jgi:hypothetical protein